MSNDIALNRIASALEKIAEIIRQNSPSKTVSPKAPKTLKAIDTPPVLAPAPVAPAPVAPAPVAPAPVAPAPVAPAPVAPAPVAPAPVAPAPVAPAPVAPAPVAPAPVALEMTVPELNACLVREFHRIGSREPIDKAMKDLGVSSIDDLSADEYPALINAVRAINV